MKTVGMPRALIYYKFAPLWDTYFQKLGAKVLVSPYTTKMIRDVAVGIAPDEDCYSTKLYYGHVMALKDKVDYFFIPRFGSNHKTNVGCPKFIGLAEVLKANYPELPEIIMPYYSKAKSKHGLRQLFKEAYKIGFKFTKNPFRIFWAVISAIRAYKKYHQKLHISKETLYKWERSEILLNDPPINDTNDKPLKIALVGHSYVINDSYASINIRKKLQEFGVDIITSEQMPRDLIENQMKKLDANLYFDYEREILGTVMHFLESKSIDGIIQMVIFACGPDSVAGEMASRLSRRKPEVPLLQLVLDDLTGEAGFRTRIEAFVDMLKRRDKENAIYIPTFRVSEVRV